MKIIEVTVDHIINFYYDYIDCEGIMTTIGYWLILLGVIFCIAVILIDYGAKVGILFTIGVLFIAGFSAGMCND